MVGKTVLNRVIKWTESKNDTKRLFGIIKLKYLSGTYVVRIWLFYWDHLVRAKIKTNWKPSIPNISQDLPIFRHFESKTFP